VTSWLSRVAARFNTKGRQLVSAADAARDRGEPAGAAQLYRQAIAAGVRSVGIRKQFANALKDSGRFEEALSEYQICLAAAPDDSDTYLQLGHLFKLRGNLQKAGEYYDLACNCSQPLAGAADELEILKRGGHYRKAEPLRLAGAEDSAVRALPETMHSAKAQHGDESIRSLAVRVDALAQQLDSYGRQAAHGGYSIVDQVFIAEARNRIDALLPMFLNMNSAIARLAAEVERLSAAQPVSGEMSTETNPLEPVRQRNGAIADRAKSEPKGQGAEHIGQS
jgi:tetratricopeptide (TPR) repeat protein